MASARTTTADGDTIPMGGLRRGESGQGRFVILWSARMRMPPKPQKFPGLGPWLRTIWAAAHSTLAPLPPIAANRWRVSRVHLWSTPHVPRQTGRGRPRRPTPPRAPSSWVLRRASRGAASRGVSGRPTTRLTKCVDAHTATASMAVRLRHNPAGNLLIITAPDLLYCGRRPPNLLQSGRKPPTKNESS